MHFCSPSLQLAALSFRFEDSPLERTRPGRFAPSLFFTESDQCNPPIFFATLDRREQSLARELAVLRLRARVLHGHANSRGAMPQRYGGRNLVYILTTRAAGTRETLFEIRFANIQARHLPVDRCLHIHAAADGRTRTGTGRLSPTDFKSVASAISPHRRRSDCTLSTFHRCGQNVFKR